MNFKTLLAAIFAAALSCSQAFGQATILPPGETCFQANVGTNGMVGLLGTITGGSLYTNGTYGGVALTGGSGSGATANITVSGGAVTAVAILNPGSQYVVGDVLSASAASIGGTGSGFSVPVSSVAINSALAGGSVAFYIPSTSTPKQTWQDAGETINNTNPVGLDANGCAVVYGAGIYRMVVQDSLGNTVYDKLTASTGPAGIFWAGTAGGTGNAITVTDAAFASQDGTTIQFRASNANTGPTTITVSGIGPISVVKDTSSGPAALSGGEIGIGNTPIVTYDALAGEFHLVNPAATSGSSGGTSSLVPPQGYLNLIGQATGDVVQTGDVTGASTLFYSPFVGSVVPIFNGTSFVNTQFSELTMTLTSAGSPANTIQDACVFSNNGVPTLVLGPSWQNVTAGTSARGTGAGTPQLNKLQGIWVNAVTITGYNGLSSYSIPASQCTYLGSVYVDGAAGQVSAYRTTGQNRKFGVWNAYNRQPIVLTVSDPTSAWSYGLSTVRASNAKPVAYVATSFNSQSGVTCNGGVIFQGLPEEEMTLRFDQSVVLPIVNDSGVANIGIGINSTSIASGKNGSFIMTSTSTASFSNDLVAATVLAPVLGVTNYVSLEFAPLTVVTPTFNGTGSNMSLRVSYRG